MSEPPTISNLNDLALFLNEMVLSLMRAGFSREESIRFCAIWTAEVNRQTPPGPDDKGANDGAS